MNSPLTTLWKLIGFTICAIYFFYCITHLSTWHIIDGMNLLMHEAGHMVFSPFGRFLTILGGTLLQIIVPCVFAIYFWSQEQFIEASVILLWIGQSIINVSVYAGDAIALQLPLLGGDTTMHDWNNLFTMMNVLPHAVGISHGIYAIGLVTMLSGIGVVIWKEMIKKI